MKRYFDLKDFLTFLTLLEENKVTDLFTESVEDGSVEKYQFIRMNFAGSDIILHDHPSKTIGIIQDYPYASWDGYAEGVYEDLVQEGEYKLFIESK